MKPCFSVLFAGNPADFSAYRTHHSLHDFTKLRPALRCSADQLEQLVGEQGDHAKHEVKPNLLGPPHHDVAAPELFFQAAVETFRPVRSR